MFGKLGNTVVILAFTIAVVAIVIEWIRWGCVITPGTIGPSGF